MDYKVIEYYLYMRRGLCGIRVLMDYKVIEYYRNMRRGLCGIRGTS